jgi:preprotein translocase subunit YajC
MTEIFNIGKVSFGNADYNELMGTAMIILGIFLIFYIVLFEKQEKKVEKKVEFINTAEVEPKLDKVETKVETTADTTEVEIIEPTTTDTDVIEIIQQSNQQPHTPIVYTDLTNVVHVAEIKESSLIKGRLLLVFKV